MQPVPTTVPSSGAQQRPNFSLNDTRQAQARTSFAAGFVSGVGLVQFVSTLAGGTPPDVTTRHSVLLAAASLGLIIAMIVNSRVASRYSTALAATASRDGLAICSGQINGGPPVPARCWSVVAAPRYVLSAVYGATAPAPAIWMAVMSVLPPDAPSRLVAVLGPLGCPVPANGQLFAVVLHPANAEIGVLVCPIYGPIESDPRWISARTPRQARGGRGWRLRWLIAGAGFGIGLASLISG